MVINKSWQSLSYPHGLNQGDSIGIVAAAGKVDPLSVEKGCRIIIENGFVPVVSEMLYNQNGYFAGTDRERSESLMSMFLDPRIKAVLCARGGYGCMRILDLLDYDLIAANPKIFMGFSDNTLILSEISTRSGFVTWHGPMVSSLGFSDNESLASFFSVLSGDRERHRIIKDIVNLSGDMVVEGLSVCGNLTTFCHTAGTKYQKDWTGRVLFIEDINEPVYKLDRMIVHMKLAGMFDGIKGIVLGGFEGRVPLSEVYDLFVREFSATEILLVAWPGFGHGIKNIPIPFGANVKIDSDSGIIEWV